MSDTPTGPDWWQASDDRWYPPETHPDYRASGQVAGPAGDSGGAPNPVEGFAPPSADQRFPTPVDPPPAGPGGQYPIPGRYPSPGPGRGPSVGSEPGVGGDPGLGGEPVAGQHARYPTAPPPQKRSSGKVLAIIFGVVFLLLAGGCGLFVYSFRDEIADATIDFSDSVEVDDEATCSVLGVDFSGNYEIEATLTAADSADESHYQLTFQVIEEDGTLVGEDMTVFRSMASGERRTENAFNVIVAEVDVDAVTCTVTAVRRVSV